MTAVQFLDPPKELINLKFKKAFERKKPEIKECHNLNYSIITFATREIADSLSVWAKRGLISLKDTAYFEKMADSDNDELFAIYKKYGRTDLVFDDFQRVVTLFQNLAKRSLSQFQIQAAPMLVDILAIIYSIQYIQVAIPELCFVMERMPQSNTMRIIREKESELQKLFMSLYQEVSNSKEFNFNIFKNMFSKIIKMTRNEYLTLTEEMERQ